MSMIMISPLTNELCLCHCDCVNVHFCIKSKVINCDALLYAYIHTPTAMKNSHTLLSHLLPFLCTLSLRYSAQAFPDFAAYPSIPGTDSGDCSIGSGDNPLVPPRREVYDQGRIFDISHRYTTEMPLWESEEELGYLMWLTRSMRNGSVANFSTFKLGLYIGTHVHSGFDVDLLDLQLLNGLALLIDVPRDKNITAEVMKSLDIPKGVQRVLFRTSNTDRRLMFKKGFDASYVGFKEDGAKWLVENTDIKLELITYLLLLMIIWCHLVLLFWKAGT
ncbi:cyclase-like protein 2 isoform X3 [Arachis duranensis]|uniref:Cyclase-like protein 2 isoform X3 n=1 Tax=Arachis duranensis TaxID=130453 RepID=A0A9C6TB13_ARADU|nr:cyclase-like protein 2 isoform X3 [Arachis duranensis]